jgi:hypothetical protein
MNRRTKKQIFAFAVLTVFIMVSVLSLSFIIGHTEHDCTGHDCTVCAQLHTAQNLLKQITTLIVGAAFLYAGPLLVWLLFQNLAARIVLLTPVSLKVRMNN